MYKSKLVNWACAFLFARLQLSMVSLFRYARRRFGWPTLAWWLTSGSLGDLPNQALGGVRSVVHDDSCSRGDVPVACLADRSAARSTLDGLHSGRRLARRLAQPPARC